MHAALHLAGLAIEAEATAIKAHTRAAGRRVALMVVAGGFATFAVALLHLAAWEALLEPLGDIATPLVIAAVDLCAAGILLLVSRRTDPTAEAAERTRDLAIAGLRPALSTAGGIVQLAGLAASVVQALHRR